MPGLRAAGEKRLQAGPRHEEGPQTEQKGSSIILQTSGRITQQAGRPTMSKLRLSVQLEEMAVIELMEHITNPTKDQGEWIAKIDLVESGDKLLVEEKAELGDCGVECKTVQRAAEEIVGDNDTDLAEELWKVIILLQGLLPRPPPPPPPPPPLPPAPSPQPDKLATVLNAYVTDMWPTPRVYTLAET